MNHNLNQLARRLVATTHPTDIQNFRGRLMWAGFSAILSADWRKPKKKNYLYLAKLNILKYSPLLSDVHNLVTRAGQFITEETIDLLVPLSTAFSSYFSGDVQLSLPCIERNWRLLNHQVVVNCQKVITEEFIRVRRPGINLYELSRNVIRKLSPRFLHDYGGSLNWNFVSQYSPVLTEEFILQHLNFIDFNALLFNYDIPCSLLKKIKTAHERGRVLHEMSPPQRRAELIKMKIDGNFLYTITKTYLNKEYGLYYA